MAVTIVIMIAIPLIFIFVFWLPNYRSIMKRARKIDPTVKTIAEAQYVLQKILWNPSAKTNRKKKAKTKKTIKPNNYKTTNPLIIYLQQINN